MVFRVAGSQTFGPCESGSFPISRPCAKLSYPAVGSSCIETKQMDNGTNRFQLLIEHNWGYIRHPWCLFVRVAGGWGSSHLFSCTRVPENLLRKQ